jgi:hypothetical protein
MTTAMARMAATRCDPNGRTRRQEAATYPHVGTTMIRQNAPADPAVHELAMRLARQCRRIVQSCLREEEWPEADREFYAVIREGLEQRDSQDSGSYRIPDA